MKLDPLGTNLLIAPISRGSTSRGGLLIPDVAKSQLPYSFGDVVAAGPGAMNSMGVVKPCTCKPGDVVAYAKSAGVDMPLEDGNSERVYRLVGEQYILGIVHGLARETSIAGVDGRLLAMMPQSIAKQDTAYENEDKYAQAKAAGWTDIQPSGKDGFEDDPVPFEGP